VVHQTMLGEGKRLKQYCIAIDCLGFADDFDTDSNPYVRIIAGRVREKLDQYYETYGLEDSVFISIPKGRYQPLIEYRVNSMTADA